MYWFSRCVGALTIAVLVLPSFGQDEKKKDKDDKAKKSVFADKGKKGAEKAADKEDKVSYGQYFSGKIKTIDANSQKNFAVEIQVPDPQKIYEFNTWKAQQLLSISRNTNPASAQQALFQYNQQMLQRQQNLSSPKDIDVQASANIKVRTNFPPEEYDDKGNLKRWTAKELQALKKGSKLPGYPAEYDVLKPGQLVAVYLAKTHAAPKAKGLKIADPAEVAERPEVVMIVVLQNPLPQR